MPVIPDSLNRAQCCARLARPPASLDMNDSIFQSSKPRARGSIVFLCSALAAALALTAGSTAPPSREQQGLELSRPVHNSEFLCAVGQKSAVFGNEAGTIEAWVYPLKLFRDFSLVFHVADFEIPAAELARTVIARPESTSVIYVSDTFRVIETFLTPVHEPGVVIRLEVETESPLEIEAVYRRDFQLEWPAGLGATWERWDSAQHAFLLSEDQKTYAALVGSPTATPTLQELNTNNTTSAFSGFRLGATQRGKDSKLIVMAASVNGLADAQASYKKLTEQGDALETDSAQYYKDYLQRTVSVEVPDAQLQKAYDWSRISVVQGLVTNPKYGTGLIAGYRTSGESQRPGFAWFFGRDALWTSFALNSDGDFEATKTSLQFLTQFQREDGRIPHEIAQTAYLVDWFKNYPYGFASADATPLYIIAIEDYVRSSGDMAFARDHWDNAHKAYEYLRSTYGANGLPQNFGVGHGWVEGGPLLPVQSELYQSGVGAEAIRCLAELAKLTGHDAEAKTLSDEFAAQREKVNEVFWLEEKQRYGFGLYEEKKNIPEATVLSTVPMWFDILDAARSKKTIVDLNAHTHTTDWGMRIISDQSPIFSAGGYHYGSVWPLFTGWAAVGEYNYHQTEAAWQNLRTNALLALDGSLGHVTEVLSGSYYQGLSTASPHQIWSAAMVVNPLLRGLFGMQTDALTHTLALAPSLPANWNSFALHNVQVGAAAADIKFQRNDDEMTLEVRRSGEGDLFLEFQPALSLRAQVTSASLNGRPIAFKVLPNESDQHLQVRFPVYGGPSVLRVQVRHDFSVSYTPHLPVPGARSEGLRILSDTWSPSRDELTLDLEGVAGKPYELSVSSAKEIFSVEGGTLRKSGNVVDALLVAPASGNDAYVRSTLVFRFAPGTAKGNR
jgi:glycogen debranching enzyme